MSKSIAVFGAGPGLGQAIAHRYARAGYAVALVARRREPLERLAADLTGAGAAAYAIDADLSKTAAVPGLAEQIRASVGNLDALYYAPSPAAGFVSATVLTAEQLRVYLPLAVDTLIALVREFLPPMLEEGDGAILTAQGASALNGMPGMSGVGPALAAQRNYLQSLHAEVAEQGVYVGRLYIGAAIKNTPFHAQLEEAKASGANAWEVPTADPAHLADLLWAMHSTKSPIEGTYPRDLFNR